MSLECSNVSNFSQLRQKFDTNVHCFCIYLIFYPMNMSNKNRWDDFVLIQNYDCLFDQRQRIFMQLEWKLICMNISNTNINNVFGYIICPLDILKFLIEDEKRDIHTNTHTKWNEMINRYVKLCSLTFFFAVHRTLSAEYSILHKIIYILYICIISNRSNLINPSRSHCSNYYTFIRRKSTKYRVFVCGCVWVGSNT